MTTFYRWPLAIIMTPILGAVASFFTEFLEHTVRHFIGHPAIVDDAAHLADKIATPLIAVGYVTFCWIYILPLSYAFRSQSTNLYASLVTAPPLLLAITLFYRPDLDSFPMTLLAMISVIGAPVYVSALGARLMLGPNNSFKLTPPRGSA